MIIAVDFDGTCVTHAYPEIGTFIGAVGPLSRLVAKGHKLILWTMRSNERLREAVQWFADNGIELWAVNTNPEQSEWTNSPKAYANLYIDDAGLGIPLASNPAVSHRPYVDWLATEALLVEMGVLD